ncbi:MAG: CHAT domain-containing protein [Paracoccaceae bacterium]
MADIALAAIEELSEQDGGSEGGLYARLKRAHLSLIYRDLDQTRMLLTGLAPWIGDLEGIEFTETGIRKWQSKLSWGPDNGERSLLTGMTCLCLGMLLTDLGQYRGALAVFSVCRDTVLRAADLPAALMPHFDLAEARAAMEYGALERARSNLDFLSELDRRTAPALYVSAMALASRYAQISGDLGQAISLQEQILGFCDSAGFPVAALTARVSRAHVWIFLNRTLAAEIDLTAAAQTAESLGAQGQVQQIEDLLQVIHSRRDFSGDVATVAPAAHDMQNPNHSQMSAASPHVTGQFDAVGGATDTDFWTRLEHRLDRFDALLATGKMADAFALGEMIQQAFSSSDSALIQARLRMVTGHMARLEGRHRDAEAAFLEAEAAFSNAGAVLDSWRALDALARISPNPVTLDSMHGNEPSLKYARLANGRLTELTETLDHEDRAAFLLDKTSLEERILTDRIRSLPALGAKRRFLFMPFREDAETSSVLNLVAELSAQRTSTTRVSSTDLIHFQNSRTATLFFVCLPSFVLAVAIDRQGCTWQRRPLSKLALRDIVAEIHLMVEAEARTADLAHPLSRLGAGLDLDTLLEGLGGYPRHLRIVADDVLHGVPFAALMHKHGYLIEKFTISYVQNAHCEPTSRLGKPETVFSLGVKEGSADFPELPNAWVEARGVAEQLQAAGLHCSVLTDQDGVLDVASVVDALEAADIAHFACHGVFQNNRLDKTGLLIVPSQKDDVLLDIQLLAGLNLQRLQSISLSSCWAADNFILPGRQVISLPDVLLSSGARSVVAPKWRISDTAALAIFGAYFERVKYHTPAKAVQSIQRELLERKAENAVPVVVWAALTAHGDCQAILAPSPRFSRVWRFLLQALHEHK